MNKIISAILSLSLLISTSNLYAQTLPNFEVPKLQLDEPNIGAAISPLKKNQRAPFTGVLFSPEAISSVIVTYQTFPDTIKLEVDKATKICLIESERKLSDQRVSNETTQLIQIARINSLNAENVELKKVIEHYQSKDSSSLSPITLIGIGTLGGVLLTLSGVYFINQIQN